MIDCDLVQLSDGNWWCPVCDPDKKRILPVKARRNCRVKMERTNAEARRGDPVESPSAPLRLRGESLRKAASELGITDKLVNYAAALARWITAGRPVRSKEHAEHIHSLYCCPCRRYDAQREVCTVCGCKARRGGMAVRNKIRMATESCPLGKW